MSSAAAFPPSDATSAAPGLISRTTTINTPSSTVNTTAFDNSGFLTTKWGNPAPISQHYLQNNKELQWEMSNTTRWPNSQTRREDLKISNSSNTLDRSNHTQPVRLPKTAAATTITPHNMKMDQYGGTPSTQRSTNINSSPTTSRTYNAQTPTSASGRTTNTWTTNGDESNTQQHNNSNDTTNLTMNNNNNALLTTSGAAPRHTNSKKNTNHVNSDRMRNPCKVFVGGVGQGTVENTIRSHFSQYGTIVDCIIVTHRKSGKSRGFGFITYDLEDAAARAVGARHKIDDVLVECRQALPKDEARVAAPHDSLYIPTKIFVGGIPDTVEEEDFKIFFSKFGEVVDVSLAYDKSNHRPRGFGFIVFSTLEAANAAVGRHMFFGKMVEAKHAVPRKPVPRGVRSGRRSSTRNSRLTADSTDETRVGWGHSPGISERGTPLMQSSVIPQMNETIMHNPTSYPEYGLLQPRQPTLVPNSIISSYGMPNRFSQVGHYMSPDNQYQWPVFQSPSSELLAIQHEQNYSDHPSNVMHLNESSVAATSQADGLHRVPYSPSLGCPLGNQPQAAQYMYARAFTSRTSRRQNSFQLANGCEVDVDSGGQGEGNKISMSNNDGAVTGSENTESNKNMAAHQHQFNNNAPRTLSGPIDGWAQVPKITDQRPDYRHFATTQPTFAYTQPNSPLVIGQSVPLMQISPNIAACSPSLRTLVSNLLSPHPQDVTSPLMAGATLEPLLPPNAVVGKLDLGTPEGKVISQQRVEELGDMVNDSSAKLQQHPNRMATTTCVPVWPSEVVASPIQNAGRTAAAGTYDPVIMSRSPILTLFHSAHAQLQHPQLSFALSPPSGPTQQPPPPSVPSISSPLKTAATSPLQATIQASLFTPHYTGVPEGSFSSIQDDMATNRSRDLHQQSSLPPSNGVTTLRSQLPGPFIQNVSGAALQQPTGPATIVAATPASLQTQHFQGNATEEDSSWNDTPFGNQLQSFPVAPAHGLQGLGSPIVRSSSGNNDNVTMAATMALPWGSTTPATGGPQALSLGLGSNLAGTIFFQGSPGHFNVSNMQQPAIPSALFSPRIACELAPYGITYNVASPPQPGVANNSQHLLPASGMMNDNTNINPISLSAIQNFNASTTTAASNAAPMNSNISASQDYSDSREELPNSTCGSTGNKSD